MELPDGRKIKRCIFETFYPGEYIIAVLLNLWAELLNINEKERDLSKSPHRLYMTTELTVSLTYLIFTLKQTNIYILFFKLLTIKT